MTITIYRQKQWTSYGYTICLSSAWTYVAYSQIEPSRAIWETSTPLEMRKWLRELHGEIR